MSLRRLRSRQESCAYRLNRAALMRMEQGRKKAMTKDEGYYNRNICIKVDNKRNTKQFSSTTNSTTEEEESKTEDDSALSEDTRKVKHGTKHRRTSYRDNTSVRSYRPRTYRRDTSKRQLSTDRKVRSGTKRRVSYKEPEFESTELNERSSVSQKRKIKVKRKETTQTASAVHSPRTSPSAAEDNFGYPKSRTSPSSSPSSDLLSPERRDSPPHESNQTNNRGSLFRNSPYYKRYEVRSEHETNSEEEISTYQSNIMSPAKADPGSGGGAEPKAGSPLPNKRYEKRSPPSKKSFDESLLVKQRKMNDDHFKYVKEPKKLFATDISLEPSVEGLESMESALKSGKTHRGRSTIKKKGGIMRPGGGSRQLYFRPATSTVTVSSDQEEVISKWRKRLGTSSPPSYLGSPNIASSFLRNSQILRVQSSATPQDNEYSLNPKKMSYTLPEKDSPDISQDDIDIHKLVGPISGKGTNEVFTPNEEQEIFFRMEMEKTKKQIHYLEQLARMKMERLEAIRWKKKRALEEEATLNEKLDKLLQKIQDLKESESFATLLDKQTQVFATKKFRSSNIK